MRQVSRSSQWEPGLIGQGTSLKVMLMDYPLFEPGIHNITTDKIEEIFVGGNTIQKSEFRQWNPLASHKVTFEPRKLPVTAPVGPVG